MLEITQKFFQWLEITSITLKCLCLANRLNVQADSLSRDHKVQLTDWSLYAEILLRNWVIWRKPHIELFATKENHNLPLYVSPIPDQVAIGVDSLNGLDKSECLHLSLNFDTDESADQADGRRTPTDNIDCSSLAQAAVVP